MSDSPSSQALTKRSADTSLMPPPPPPKRIKRPSKVLDEDVYTDALSHIIARDFFPGLLETQAQTEYLEALDSKNADWIRDASRKLHQAMTPGPGGQRGRRGTSVASTARGTSVASTARGTHVGATPRGWEGETPRRTLVTATPAMSTATNDDDDDRPKHVVDSSLSLAAFQTKYTSEDNESFNALLDKQNLKRAQKYAFLYAGNKMPSHAQLTHRAHQSQLLLDAASQDGTTRSLAPLRPSQDLDTRPTTIETFKSRQGPRNSLMFAPDSIEDTLPTVAQAAASSSLAPPKSLSYASTRLPPPTTSTASSIPASPSLSAIDAAIAGNPRPSSTAPPSYTGSETPRVHGYAFVDTEPEPHELLFGTPVSDAEADAQDRESAMKLLLTANGIGAAGDSGDAKGAFKLQKASRREELHHELVDRQSEARRKPQGRMNVLKGSSTPGRTPTPRFASGVGVARGVKRAGGGNLTPAGRMLAARIGGRTPGREKEGSLFGEGERGAKSRAWTPTPRVKRG